MRTIFFSIVVSLFALMASKCNKDPLTPPEENLIISTDAPDYSETPGPDFNLHVTVESAMPPGGVRISFMVKGEVDNISYSQNPAIETNDKTSSIRLINLPQQKFCVCTVTVVSKSKSTNSASKNFRVVYK
ncbi:MAG TPA: hypothetical protein VFU29_10590 [Chitinophagaceae bacterium]|nr:hypothetical protein [Chitinophagaceae bacterium]